MKFTLNIDENSDQTYLHEGTLEECFYKANLLVYKEERCVQITDENGIYLTIHSDTCACNG